MYPPLKNTPWETLTKWHFENAVIVKRLSDDENDDETTVLKNGSELTEVNQS